MISSGNHEEEGAWVPMDTATIRFCILPWSPIP